MPRIMSSLQSRLMSRVIIATSVFLCFICIAAWGEDYLEHHLVQPVGGEYSTTLSAEKVRIEYFDSYHGELFLKTLAAGYSDDFYLTSESFSGSHTADAYSLAREIKLSGGGEIHAVTRASSTVAEVTFLGSYINLSQNFDFGNEGVDLPGVSVFIDFKDPVPAWLEIFYNGDDAEIHAFARAFGLSEAQATSLYRGGALGLIGELSRFGYSQAEVVSLILAKGLDYVRGLLATLETSYVPSIVDKAAVKFGIPWAHAKTLFNETDDHLFVSAVRSSKDYAGFIGNLLGWMVAGRMLAGEDGILAASQPAGGGAAVGSSAPFIAEKTLVKVGEPVRFAFKLLHPANHELVFVDPWLAPYLSLTKVQSDGSIMALGGYYGYILFQLNPQTGEYFSYLDTSDLAPGVYDAYLSVRNPANDIQAESRVRIKIREPIYTYYWGG